MISQTGGGEQDVSPRVWSEILLFGKVFFPQNLYANERNWSAKGEGGKRVP